VASRRSYLYFRPERNESGIVRAAAAEGVVLAGIVRSKYLVTSPDGHTDAGRDDGGSLAKEFRSAGVPYLIDPDTFALCQKALEDDSVEPRLRGTLGARAVQLPLHARTLGDPGVRSRFVRANIDMQVGATGVIAPYFEVRSKRDPRLELNLQLIQETREALSDRRPVVAISQVTRHRLLVGLIAELAPLYARSGAQRFLLRVRGLTVEAASEAEARAYLASVTALRKHRVRVVPDCVGRFGPVTVAVGAHAFSTGTRFFRKVAETPIHIGGGGHAGELVYELPGRLRAVRVGERRLSTVPVCTVDGCVAAEAALDTSAIRMHALHTLNETAQLAAELGPVGFASRLRVGGDDHELAWARVLEDYAAGAASA